MTEQWWCSSCPKCKEKNWINNGDPSDLTVMDVEGIRCWSCQHCWRLSEELDYADEMEDNDDPYFEDGRHFEEIKHEKS